MGATSSQTVCIKLGPLRYLRLSAVSADMHTIVGLVQNIIVYTLQLLW